MRSKSKGSGLAIIHSVPGNSIHKDPATGIPFETNVLLQDLTPVALVLGLGEFPWVGPIYASLA
jgi:hypothetical protein